MNTFEVIAANFVFVLFLSERENCLLLVCMKVTDTGALCVDAL